MATPETTGDRFSVAAPLPLHMITDLDELGALLDARRRTSAS
ncbi:MAG: hypothetical protein ACRDRP_14585 [Pseudonocardiaceae bacterium]